jgi:protein gp37
MIVVNSMSDLSHELVPLDFIKQVFEVMASAEQHTFQILTKARAHGRTRPGALLARERLDGGEHREPPLGRACVYLRQVPAAVRFISAEPLLGPLDELDLSDIDC